MLLVFLQGTCASALSSDPHAPQPPLPKEIVIGLRVFAVKPFPEPTPIAQMLEVLASIFWFLNQGITYGSTCDEDAFYIGHCYELKTFYINNKASFFGKFGKQDTMFHELLHGIVGTGKSNEKVSCTEFAQAVSPGLLEAFRRNPDLVAFLRTGRGKEPSPPSVPSLSVTYEAQEGLLFEAVRASCEDGEKNPIFKTPILPGTYHHAIWEVPSRLLSMIQGDPSFMDRLLARPVPEHVIFP